MILKHTIQGNRKNTLDEINEDTLSATIKDDLNVFPTTASKYWCCPNRHCETVCSEKALQRVRKLGLLLVVFSLHQEVGKSRCPSALWAAKWVRSGAATDTRAQMVWQKTCRKPLFAWVSCREGLPSLPACRDARSTSQSGGSKAMCYRLALRVQRNSYSHKHKYTCICRNVQIRANPVLSWLRRTLTPAHCTQRKARRH